MARIDLGKVVGPQGPQGIQGPQGLQGKTGPTGDNGATYTPSVNNEGYISWTNDKGLSNPNTVNIRGPKGADGSDYIITEADYREISGIAVQNLHQYTSGIYEGVDLTQAFADEIAASPYSGDPWAWIRARIRAGDYRGIHIKDYIPFVTANNIALNAEIAGINTYKNYGDTAVGNHIDFICRELWPTRKPLNPVNYNNGLIPVETLTGDGSTTSFVLTKEMTGIASATQNGERLTGYTYDASTFTLTFTEAPAAGDVTVTGTGAEHPWLASDLYHWLNSLSGQIPNSSELNPTVKHVDYTQDGVYYYLPDTLKSVIVEKRAYLPKRYSVSGLLNDDNAGGWENIGKLWLPTENEVYGIPVWGVKGGYTVSGSVSKYPIFVGNMNSSKFIKNGGRSSWWALTVSSGNHTNFCIFNSRGITDHNYTSASGVAAPVCFRVA